MIRYEPSEKVTLEAIDIVEKYKDSSIIDSIPEDMWECLIEKANRELEYITNELYRLYCTFMIYISCEEFQTYDVYAKMYKPSVWGSKNYEEAVYSRIDIDEHQEVWRSSLDTMFSMKLDGFNINLDIIPKELPEYLTLESLNAPYEEGAYTIYDAIKKYTTSEEMKKEFGLN